MADPEDGRVAGHRGEICPMMAKQVYARLAPPPPPPREWNLRTNVDFSHWLIKRRRSLWGLGTQDCVSHLAMETLLTGVSRQVLIFNAAPLSAERNCEMPPKKTQFRRFINLFRRRGLPRLVVGLVLGLVPRKARVLRLGPSPRSATAALNKERILCACPQRPPKYRVSDSLRFLGP